jgi:hypothetical protein
MKKPHQTATHCQKFGMHQAHPQRFMFRDMFFKAGHDAVVRLLPKKPNLFSNGVLWAAS